MKTMGQRIHEKRVEYGWTLEELGEKLGVKKSSISKWENGDVQNIKRSCIARMAELFHCSPVWLMGYDDASDVKLTYSAPGRETVTTRVDQKSKPIIGETALRMELYNAALDVPTQCLETAIKLLRSLSTPVVDGFVYDSEDGHHLNIEKR